ncbi:Metal ion ABC transporter, permease protein [Alteracholeplasma palmae J233]|uniref:Metal ion ABC transporter, permease protein n=1 Tax=Alteracholeplasma palmae (strain ATCC 49389 / J233) TaxID=1318466 RepID=U4KKJ3_ALTPJ|nr:metal ABC transporter permease [Alteracholeplasma palmae]CCV64142.1 Metal ion ABC transporter, permease protein [Alteracholeplasma palmae J233]
MEISVLFIAILTSISCSILGVFLVLRKMSMMIDAISHTVLLGIVIAFMFVADLSSPLLVVGATLMGLVTVFLTEFLVKTKRTTEDAATGVIFPLLFSLAIIIISKSYGGVHLDVDAVLLGKLELASFDQLVVNGVEIGPKLLYLMGGMLVINLVVTKLFFKEFKIVSFDSALAATLGFAPWIINYLLMTLVSLTAVSAFNAVGTVLVIALMIGPAITALLVTKNLSKTILLSVGIGIFDSVIGYVLAIYYDVSIAGMISTVILVVFLLVLVFEPKKGILTTVIRRKIQKNEFAVTTLLMHIRNHTLSQEASVETNVHEIYKELNWNKEYYNKCLNRAFNKQYITKESDLLRLTEIGDAYLKLKSKDFVR